MSALSLIDIIIIIGFLLVSVISGILLSRKARKNVDSFFLSGRNLPWWLAGISMIATSFAIDTPLGIAGFVASHGIKGVWFAWSYVLGGAGVLGAFVFASLLRRSRIMTTAELVELRYGGKPAAGLRFFKGIYFGILSNCIIMAWVMKAVSVFTEALFGWPGDTVLIVLLLFTLAYTMSSGMWGIVVTDFFQYFVSTVGSILLAVMALKATGGISGLITSLHTHFGIAKTTDMLSFFPSPGSDYFLTILVFLTIKWWGNPPEAINQRMVSCKNEKHSSLATILFATTHFALNYWPMIIVALAALVLFPDLTHQQQVAGTGYAMAIATLLPHGILGIVIAALLAAFMSTIDTHVNVGAAYMINDLYRRFINKHGSTKHYVHASQIATVIMLVLAVLIARHIDSVAFAWKLLSKMLGGYGFVLVARWFWWRINAWTEITALISSLLAYLFTKTSFFISHATIFLHHTPHFGEKFLTIFVLSTLSWVIVTFLTKPTDTDSLLRFCKIVRPYPLGWNPIFKKYPDLGWDKSLKLRIFHWFIGAISIFSLCFGTGFLIFHETVKAIILFAISIAGLITIVLTWRNILVTEHPD